MVAVAVIPVNAVSVTGGTPSLFPFPTDTFPLDVPVSEVCEILCLCPGSEITTVALCVCVGISADDNTRIGDTNTYSGVGIVRSPSFAGSVPTVFDNRISVTTNDIDRLTANSTVTQVNSDNEITFSGKVHEIDASANTFYIAEYMGPYQNNADTGQGDTSLDLTLPFRNEAGQTITINSPVIDNVVTSDYTQRTGEVYFMEDFFPLARTELSREEFKFVLEF